MPYRNLRIDCVVGLVEIDPDDAHRVSVELDLVGDAVAYNGTERGPIVFDLKFSVAVGPLQVPGAEQVVHQVAHDRVQGDDTVGPADGVRAPKTTDAAHQSASRRSSEAHCHDRAGVMAS